MFATHPLLLTSPWHIQPQCIPIISFIIFGLKLQNCKFMLKEYNNPLNFKIVGFILDFIIILNFKVSWFSMTSFPLEHSSGIIFLFPQSVASIWSHDCGLDQWQDRIWWKISSKGPPLLIFYSLIEYCTLYSNFYFS